MANEFLAPSFSAYLNEAKNLNEKFTGTLDSDSKDGDDLGDITIDVSKKEVVVNKPSDGWDNNINWRTQCEAFANDENDLIGESVLDTLDAAKVEINWEGVFDEDSETVTFKRTK